MQMIQLEGMVKTWSGLPYHCGLRVMGTEVERTSLWQEMPACSLEFGEPGRLEI